MGFAWLYLKKSILGTDCACELEGVRDGRLEQGCEKLNLGIAHELNSFQWGCSVKARIHEDRGLGQRYDDKQEK
jgi:hypothetical protein